ncbi:hypothetical protein [Candidatus Nitrosocosmicus franklandus]|uniref:GYD domain protein n=1 Tax=Candidatus Nitrosocosmicus franklandianus TaxID=1798806 RepID=A0A484ICG6_9ARCH|nr:hypothetical protein [Candidatus Nitrosocosmicus franklandus]VFJ13360.1 conserved protein of unknown function [Candidatus Nitrosocosmicus franklandus]
MSSFKLFGIFAVHSPESCPLNNSASKEVFKEIYNKMQLYAERYGISEINGFYMSVLEHEWIILVKADSAHQIEQICIESGISAFNTIKIVPLTNYEDVLKRIDNP